MTEHVPDGDVLLHAGDIMNSGHNSADVFNFLDWFGSFKHKHKIFIAGNHDRLFQSDPDKVADIIRMKNRTLRKGKITYLQDSEVVIDGVKFYGSPWQPEFCNWAFNVYTSEELRNIWAKIPDDTDVLITHGPAFGILDFTVYDRKSVGCRELANRIKTIKPMLHVCGHIHEAYGAIVVDHTTYVNASICTLQYRPINVPLVFDFDSITGNLIEIKNEHS